MILGLLLAGALGASLHGSGVVGAGGEVFMAPQMRTVRRFRSAFTGIVRECGPRGCFRPGEDSGARTLRTVQDASYAETVEDPGAQLPEDLEEKLDALNKTLPADLEEQRQQRQQLESKTAAEKETLTEEQNQEGAQMQHEKAALELHWEHAKTHLSALKDKISAAKEDGDYDLREKLVKERVELESQQSVQEEAERKALAAKWDPLEGEQEKQRKDLEEAAAQEEQDLQDQQLAEVQTLEANLDALKTEQQSGHALQRTHAKENRATRRANLTEAQNALLKEMDDEMANLTEAQHDEMQVLDDKIAAAKAAGEETDELWKTRDELEAQQEQTRTELKEKRAKLEAQQVQDLNELDAELATEEQDLDEVLDNEKQQLEEKLDPLEEKLREAKNEQYSSRAPCTGVLQSLSKAAYSPSTQFNDDNCREPQINSSFGWCAESSGSHMDVDLGAAKVVSGVVTQGREDKDEWIKRYRVEYSQDKSSWSTVGEFDGNSDRSTKKEHYFSHVTARYVRFKVLDSHEHESGRFDVLACEAGTCPSGWTKLVVQQEKGGQCFSPAQAGQAIVGQDITETQGGGCETPGGANDCDEVQGMCTALGARLPTKAELTAYINAGGATPSQFGVTGDRNGDGGHWLLDTNNGGQSQLANYWSCCNHPNRWHTCVKDMTLNTDAPTPAPTPPPTPAPTFDPGYARLGDMLVSNFWRTPDEIRSMSKDERRNTVIVELHKKSHLWIEELQQKSSKEMASMIDELASMADEPQTSPTEYQPDSGGGQFDSDGSGEFWKAVEPYDGKVCTDTTSLSQTASRITVSQCAEVCKRNPACKYFSLHNSHDANGAVQTECVGCTSDWGRRPDGSYFSVQEVAEGTCTGCKAHFGSKAYVIAERTMDCKTGMYRSERTGDCVAPEVEGNWLFSTCGEAVTQGKCSSDRWVSTHCCSTCVEDCRCDRTIYYIEGKQYDTKTFTADELNSGNRGMEEVVEKCRGFWNDPARGDELGTQYGFAVHMRSNGDGICRRVRERLNAQDLRSAQSTLGFNKVGAFCDVSNIPTPTDAAEAAASGGGEDTADACPDGTCADCTSMGNQYAACMQCQMDACRCKPTAAENKGDVSPNNLVRPCTWHTKSPEGRNVCSCKNLFGRDNIPEDYLRWWHTTPPPSPLGMR
jgi:hypothetical protein